MVGKGNKYPTQFRGITDSSANLYSYHWIKEARQGMIRRSLWKGHLFLEQYTKNEKATEH